MHVSVAVVQTTTQSSIFSSLLVLFPSFFLSCHGDVGPQIS
jgi:hypothetical protein